VEGYIDMLFAAKSARNDWYKIVNVVYKNEVMDGALHFKCIDVGERGEHVYIECSEIMTNSKNKQYVLRKPIRSRSSGLHHDASLAHIGTSLSVMQSVVRVKVVAVMLT
jgi:hypothetical protein